MSSQEGGKTGSAVGVNEYPLSETASDSKGESMEKGEADSEQAGGRQGHWFRPDEASVPLS